LTQDDKEWVVNTVTLSLNIAAKQARDELYKVVDKHEGTCRNALKMKWFFFGATFAASAASFGTGIALAKFLPL